jgi:polar amino acid transport system ATP-binding protein
VAGLDADGNEVNRKNASAVRRQRVGMVFQAFNLFPHRTALENVMEAPLYVQRKSRDEARIIARALLERVGLEDQENQYPSQLSGGQQQRVAIARTLATKPDLILFDEVTSSLDPELTSEVLSVMFDLAKAGQTMVVVTHEIGFARQVASRVAYLDHGHIVEEGTADEFFRNPQENRTREFLSKVLRFDSL